MYPKRGTKDGVAPDRPASPLRR